MLFIDHSDIIECGLIEDGITDYLIEKAEQKLEVIFPESYKLWLKNYGWGETHGDIIYIVTESMGEELHGDIVYENLKWRSNYNMKNSMLVFQKNDQAMFYYFDLSKLKDGEAPIYVNFGNHHEKYADNFLDFFRKKILE